MDELDVVCDPDSVNECAAAENECEELKDDEFDIDIVWLRCSCESENVRVSDTAPLKVLE